MTPKFFVGALVGALLICGAVAEQARADTFTLNNSAGGDGFVNVFPGGFDLFGADDHTEILQANLTTFTAVAGSNQSINFFWIYRTNDEEGAGFDPAGYILNGIQHKLTEDFGSNLQDGIVHFSVLAGQTYGIYVFSLDSCCGRADISVTGINATPLPAALPLFASGAGVLGYLGWRRKKKTTALRGATS